MVWCTLQQLFLDTEKPGRSEKEAGVGRIAQLRSMELTSNKTHVGELISSGEASCRAEELGPSQ